MWAPNNLVEAERTELRLRLTILVFSRDGLIPFDPACPETRLGTSGHLYSQHGLIAATYGSIKTDGRKDVSACWPRPDLVRISFEVHRPPNPSCPSCLE